MAIITAWVMTITLLMLISDIVVRWLSASGITERFIRWFWLIFIIIIFAKASLYLPFPLELIFIIVDEDRVEFGLIISLSNILTNLSIVQFVNSVFQTVFLTTLQLFQNVFSSHHCRSFNVLHSIVISYDRVSFLRKSHAIVINGLNNGPNH